MSNDLTIVVSPENIEITHHDNCVEVHIKNDNIPLVLNMDGDGMINSKGDFYIQTEGELGFITHGKPLCLDSVDSEIHFNYRQSKPLIDNPKSIEYRKDMDKENKKCIQIATMQEQQNKLLKDRVTILEDKLDETGRLLNEFVKSMRGK